MKNKNLVLVLLAALVAGTLGGWLISSPQSTVAPVITRVNPVGAIASPIITSDYLNVNGFERHYRSQSFLTASTTRCALRSPTSATSTLSSDSVIRSATTSNYTLDIAKATTPFATTTIIRSIAITTNGGVATKVASTTLNDLSLSDLAFSPGEYLVVSASGPTPTAFAHGSCSAIFNVGK